jgi:hypothetical protein
MASSGSGKALSGPRGAGPQTGCADEAGATHQFIHLRAGTLGAFDRFIVIHKYQSLKAMIALFALKFVYRHRFLLNPTLMES